MVRSNDAAEGFRRNVTTTCSWYAKVLVVLMTVLESSYTLSAADIPAVRAQSEDETDELDEDVDEQPDRFVTPRSQKQEKKTSKTKSDTFRVSKTSGDGVGIIGQGGHLGFKTFGRNDSITPAEILPYVLTDEHFFFSDIRGFISNQAMAGGNIGIGYRNLREDLNAWYGGSLWYDADGTSGKFYQQIGLSFEGVINQWELRSNVYLPMTSTQTFANTITSPRIIGHQLVYNQAIDQGVALTGADFEAGYNLPVREPHRLRGFVGYYRFDGGSSGAVNGFKTRLESVINNSVTTQILYTNDPLFGSNIMVGCQLQFPMGKQHPTGKWKQNTPSPFRFVERNYNVIVSHEQSANSDIVAYNPATNSPYEIQQVSSTAGYGGDGTSSNPFATVAEALQAGGDVIFVQGNSVLSEAVVLSNGQRLIGDGSGQSLPLRGGGTVSLPNLIASAQTPQFDGVNGNAVTLASNSEVSGFSFTNIMGSAIVGSSVTNGSIRDNSFTNISGDAIAISNASGTFRLINIDVNSTTGDGVRFDGGSADLIFRGITITGTQGDGIELANLSGGSVLLSSPTLASTTGAGLLLRNVAEDVNVYSLSASNTLGPAVSIIGGTSSDTYHFLNTTEIESPSGLGFSFHDSAADLTVDKLAVTSTANAAAVSLANSTGDIVLSYLSIDTTNATGLEANTVASLTVTDGTITTINAPAVDVQSSTIGVSLTKVSVDGGPFGIQLLQDVGTFIISGADAYGSGGTIKNTTTGIIATDVGTVGASWVDLTGNGVAIQSTGNDKLSLSGLRITNSSGYALDSFNDQVVMMLNSTLSGNGALGGGTIRGQVDTVASYQWLIQNNSITDANGTPILLSTQSAGAGASLAATVKENTITASRSTSSLVNMTWDGPLSALVSANTLKATAANMTGVQLHELSSTDTVVAQVSGNTMTFADTQGTGVLVDALASNTIQVDTNTITFNGVNGTGLRFDLSGTSSSWIYSNTIKDAAGGATGMLFDNVAASSRLQIEANTITLLSSDLTVHRGIIFSVVSPTIQFSGSYNNVISNASTAFSIPVNSSTGGFYVNGSLVQ
ncbi:MAG: inverse autotransporter beta domain-containing protein [Planctomycetes bacterium]|nr:inverse autotransporter beta domain-containing protein [Planctomycetota bacterium]